MKRIIGIKEPFHPCRISPRAVIHFQNRINHEDADLNKRIGFADKEIRHQRIDKHPRDHFPHLTFQISSLPIHPENRKDRNAAPVRRKRAEDQNRLKKVPDPVLHPVRMIFQIQNHHGDEERIHDTRSVENTALKRVQTDAEPETVGKM